MQRAFQPDDLMAILDGIDDGVVKLDGQANFAAMNKAAASIYQRLKGVAFVARRPCPGELRILLL